MVNECSTCQKYQASQPREHFIPQEVPPSPWQTVATDLFSWGQHSYLIVADPYSRFPVIRRLNSLTSQSMIGHLRSLFDEYGIDSEIL